MALPTANYIAENRFGYGPKAGVPHNGDSQAWLLDQLKKSTNYSLLSKTGNSVEAFYKLRQLKKEMKQDAKENNTNNNTNNNEDDNDPQQVKDLKRELQENFSNEVGARIDIIRTTDAPFLERLVWFWNNHFTVSMAGKGVVAPYLGSYDREAIRPHVTGYFYDMLKAVVMHPAMLLFLDNEKSVNPNMAQKFANRPKLFEKVKDKGLNENLARELMELHTLGVNGGYTQADVTSFAHVLTGWSIEKPDENINAGFQFRNNIHDETPQTIMGRAYPQKGMDQGLAVLNQLAHHPSTAKFISTKLARHFINDNPPQAAVDRMSQAFMSSNGYLPAVYQALIQSPEVWQKTYVKAKTHWDYVTSSLRMFPDVEFEPKKIVGVLNQMGQRPWNAASPQGWVDNSAVWLTPDSIWKRIEWAGIIGNRTSVKNDARAIADSAFGNTLSAESSQSIARAESGQQAISLLLLSPEFQRR